MFSLAKELHSAGKKVIASTTTKIWLREAQESANVLIGGDGPGYRNADLEEALRNEKCFFLGRKVLESGKVEGVAPEIADEIYGNQEIDYLILEGDGSAGHPVKAPADHEPVVPASATMVIAMLGLDALWQSAVPEVVFRLNLFEEITRARPGEVLTPAILARVFLEPRGMFKGAPRGARRIAFLNKIDLSDEDKGARELASMILGKGPAGVERVVIGSLREKRYQVMEAQDERDL